MSLKIEKYVLCGFMWLGFVNIHAQNTFPSPIVPPSINATELGRFGNVPVSLFTGTINQSIPIANIPIGNYTLSLGISYNGQGVKVQQEASNVGLSWVLNAGGAIVRSVVGLPDEEYYLQPGSIRVPLTGEMEPKDDFLYYLGLSENKNVDAQPDIFYYNFDGKSGRFFFDQDKNVFIAKQDDIKISWVNTGRFEVVIENGYKYIFEDLEISSNDNKIGTVYSFPSAWYLTSLELPNGTEIVSYLYDNYDTFTKQYQSKTFTHPNSIYSVNGAAFFCNTDLPVDNGGTYITSIQAKIIKEINFRNGKVTFDYSSREDHLLEKKIDKISVSSTEGKIKECVLQYSYFNNDAEVSQSDLKRLKLEKLIFKDKASTKVNEYQFFYNESIALPPKTSFAQDHWGYYNGKNTNPHLVPTYKYTYYDNTGAWPREIAGADRSTDIDYVKTAALTKIVYPTGGFTNFTYEANDIGGGSEWKYPETGVTKTVATDIVNNVYTQELTFTVNKDATTALISASFPSKEYLDDNGIKCSPSFSFINVTLGTSVANIDNFAFTQDSYLGNVVLEKGNTYKIIVTETDSRCYNSSSYTPYLESDLSITFTDWDITLPQIEVPISKIKVGGLRIQKIESFDETSNVTNIRTFDYSGGINKSSGILTEEPIYEYMQQFQSNDPTLPPSDCGNATCNYLIRRASSLVELGTIQGSHIGYEKATERNGNNGENGKIVYEYSFIKDPGGSNNAAGEFPFPPASSYDFFRGNLLKQTTYNSDQQVVKTITNEYDSRQLHSVTGMKVGKIWAGIDYMTCLNPALFTNPTPFNDNFYNPNYYLINGISRITRTSETLHLASGDVEKVTKFDYYHDNLLPSRIETSTSNGETKIVYNTYCFDYNSGNTSIDYLSDKHIWLPIESVELIKNSNSDYFVSSAQLTKYSLTYGGLPAEIHSAELISPLEIANWKFSNQNLGILPVKGIKGDFNPDGKFTKQVEALRYDVYGNLGEQQKKDDVKHSYLWNYREQYPIAEATNASYSDIAYTSFEADGKGNWTYAGTPFTEPLAPTGKKVYNLSSASITKSINSSTTYIISYWRPTGSSALSIAGTVSGYPISGRTVNGWKYYEHKISAQSTATISGSGNIDELRLYPAGAMMTTYTYDPLIGMTSQCDVNNRITYYEYDGFGRLMLVKDQDKNILKQLCYNYAGQVQDCNAACAPAAPPAPGNLTAVINGGSAVELNWVNNAVNATVNEVYRSAGDATHYALLVTLPDNVSTYTDIQTDINTLYFYKIKAAGSGGSSAYSNEESITTPAVSPSALSNTAPVLNGIADIYVRSGSSKTAGIAATDDGGDILGFVVSGLPAFASFSENGNGTGAFHLSPVNTAPGSFSVTVKVIDNYGAYSQKVINIIVVDKDTAAYHINFNNIDYPVADPLWNSFNSTKTGGVQVLANTILYALKDETGTASAISVKLLNSWPQNYLGLVTGDDSGVYPDAVIATGYYFYVQASAPAKTIKIAGLKADKKYDLTFYGNRTYGSDQVTNYTVGAQTVTLNARNNTSNTVQITGLAANSQGEIDIVVDAVMTKYATINAMVITEYPNN